MAFIQQKAEQATSSVSSFTTTAMTVGAGNSIVASMSANGGILTSLNASDSKVDSYANGVATVFNINGNATIGWAKNITGGSTTFTVTPNSARFVSISAQEYDPLGASSEATNNGQGTGNPISPGAVNPASANDLYVSCWTHNGGGNETFTFNVSGEGWNQRSNLTNTTNQPLGSQDLIASGSKTGSANASASVSYQACVATFQTLAVSSRQLARARTIKTDRVLTPGDGGQRTFSPRRAMSGTRIQEGFSGATIANSTLSAPGDSTASFVGAAQANSTLSAPGSATATFVGASMAASVLAAAGDSTATFVGASLAKSVLASTADSTATFVGAAKANSVLSAAADSTATFTGSSKAAAVLSAPGDATASFTGASQAASTLSATGDSAASFVGRSDAAAVWNASADASCSWIGTSGGNALSAAGDSTAIFVGAALAAAVLASVSDSSASFIAGLGDAEVAKTYYGHGGKRLKDDREEVEKRWELAELRKKNQAEKAALVKISETAVDSDGPKPAIKPSVTAVEAAQAEADVVLEEHEILSLLALALIADSA